jgi:leucyl aminopeptidase
MELSTLTGAMFVALGTHMAGVFSSNTTLWNSLQTAGYQAGDPFWRMPMHPGYLKQMESRIADLSNDGVRFDPCFSRLISCRFVVEDHVQPRRF